MYSTNAKGGHRRTRTKATFAATKKGTAGPEEDTPTVRQRIAEARKSGVLNLRGLNLPSLPVAAEKLDNVSALLLGQNRLTSVPNNLPTLFPDLTYLDLSWNKLSSSLPATLAELTDLEVLDVEGNTELSTQLGPALRRLVDMSKLAVLTGDTNVSTRDLHLGETSATDESEHDDDQTEEQPAWRKDYYDTDDEEEAKLEEGGYEDDNDIATSDNRSEGSIEGDTTPLTVDNLTTEFALLMHRIAGLENDELTAAFKKRWRSGDPVFVRYVAKRYAADAGKAVTHGIVGYRKKDRKQQSQSFLNVPGSADELRTSSSPAASWHGSDESDASDDDAESAPKPLKDRSAKKQIDYARKEKERAVKAGVKAGRKTKGMVMDDQ
ncbi:hypothetical protein DFJ77DRAFT_473111 [Powellomyces hirtus]|nr:hypothetical protein DFJ77DRAFT_473111 [Powellomyces hirtus]